MAVQQRIGEHQAEPTLGGGRSWLRLSPIIDAALRERAIEAATRPAALLKLIAGLGLRPDAAARQVLLELEHLAMSLLDEREPTRLRFAAQLALEVARLHQETGRPEQSLLIATTIECRIARLHDKTLEGKALLALATAAMQRDDSRSACRELERLNIHAARRPRAGLKLAAMGTAVIVLERMGLLNDARALALKLLDYPVQSSEGQLAHVLNAINGVRISHLVDHVDAASLFVEVLSEWAIDVSPQIPVDVWARAGIARAAHLTAQGKPLQSRRLLEHAIARCPEPATHAVVALHCALALAVVASSEAEAIENVYGSVVSLLDETKHLPAAREELLRAAIGLRLASRADDARSRAMEHVDALRLSIALEGGRLPSLLRSPMCFERAVGAGTRDVPACNDTMWLYEGVDGMCVSFDRDGISLFTEPDFELDRCFGAAIKPSDVELEATLRTPQYEVAENWAIAVEVAAGGTGRQCFKVGRIAAALSAALGLSSERSAVIELACRLRQVGRASIGLSPDDLRCGRAWGDPSVLRDEALAGDRILSFANDPTTTVASRVMRQRHLWWNGCGPLSGARGDAIAIEARICAVTEAFVGLVDPLGGGRRWSVERALAQVQTMAGVQLDPELVELLVRAVRFDDVPLPIAPIPWIESVVEAGRLAEANRRLRKTLELAA